LINFLALDDFSFIAVALGALYAINSVRHPLPAYKYRRKKETQELHGPALVASSTQRRTLWGAAGETYHLFRPISVPVGTSCHLMAFRQVAIVHYKSSHKHRRKVPSTVAACARFMPYLHARHPPQLLMLVAKPKRPRGMLLHNWQLGRVRWPPGTGQPRLRQVGPSPERPNCDRSRRETVSLVPVVIETRPVSTRIGFYLVMKRRRSPEQPEGD
jgi:hypothetical protein